MCIYVCVNYDVYSSEKGLVEYCRVTAKQVPKTIAVKRRRASVWQCYRGEVWRGKIAMMKTRTGDGDVFANGFLQKFGVRSHGNRTVRQTFGKIIRTVFLKGWVSIIYKYYIHKHAQTCLKIFRTYHYAPYIKFILSGYVTSRTDASCTMNIDHWRHQ